MLSKIFRSLISIFLSDTTVRVTLHSHNLTGLLNQFVERPVMLWEWSVKEDADYAGLQDDAGRRVIGDPKNLQK